MGIKTKEKKEKKEKRRKEKERKGQTGDSIETALPEPDNACEDGDSGDTCTSYGTESVCSARSSRSARSVAESEDEASSSRRPRGAKSSSKMPAASADGVRVLSLADIKGQDLATNLDKPDQNRGDLSARSARSEGGRSARSDCQSEGGRSVASVSVKKYLGYLS